MNLSARSFTPSIRAFLCFGFSLFGVVSDSQGAASIPHTWAPALKQAIGTAYEPAGRALSPVWFTVAEGILTEVFYPRADQAQVGDLQFIITSGAPGKHTFSEQKRDTVSRVEFADGSSSDVRISGEAKDGSYRFVQTLATDPANPVLRIKTRIEWSAQPNGNPNRVFILFMPALRYTGNSDRAWVTSDY